MRQKSKNWFFLFLGNFLGVFNDNFLKHAIVFVSMSWALPRWLTTSQIIAAVSASLLIPYLLFSPLAGQLTKKYDNQKLFTLFKVLEIPVLLLAALAFYYQWIFFAIFLVLIMGILTCLYSPAKYSLIIEISKSEENAFGSGMLEAMAFLGILLATIAASFLSDHYQFKILIFTFLGVGILGLISAYSIKVDKINKEEKKRSQNGFIAFIKNNWEVAKNHRLIRQAIIGYAIFWSIAGLLQMNLIIHSKNVFNCSNSMIGIIMGIAAIGIIIGCSLAARIIKKKFYIISIFSSTLLISLLLIAIIYGNLNISLFSTAIFFIAFAGGFFQVPCLAMIQNINIGNKLGDIMAFLNFITFLFILIFTLLFSIITKLSDDNSFAVFALMLILSLGVVFYILFYLFRRKIYS